MADRPAVASPCTGVCRIDPASGWCEGCLRTIDEIAAWSTLDNGARQLIREELGQRRAGFDGAAPRQVRGADEPIDGGIDSAAGPL